MTKEKSYFDLDKTSDGKNSKNIVAQSPIKGMDSTLLNLYKAKTPVDKTSDFEKKYEDAISLIGGDKLLRNKKDSSRIIIRKTSTAGVYKVLMSENLSQAPQIKIMDETELFKNYVKGTISKLSNDSYEITYFDHEGDVVIEHFNKVQCVDFMDKNSLIF